MSEEDTPYALCLRLVGRLHLLEVQGRDETPEADAIRDDSEVSWLNLTAEHRAGLTEPLYFED